MEGGRKKNFYKVYVCTRLFKADSIRRGIRIVKRGTCVAYMSKQKFKILYKFSLVQVIPI